MNNTVCEPVLNFLSATEALGRHIAAAVHAKGVHEAGKELAVDTSAVVAAAVTAMGVGKGSLNVAMLGLLSTMALTKESRAKVEDRGWVLAAEMLERLDAYKDELSGTPRKDAPDAKDLIEKAAAGG